MTKGQAIEILKGEKGLTCADCMHPQVVDYCKNHCGIPQAYDMAIKALEERRDDEGAIEQPKSS